MYLNILILFPFIILNKMLYIIVLTGLYHLQECQYFGMRWRLLEGWLGQLGMATWRWAQHEQWLAWQHLLTSNQFHIWLSNSCHRWWLPCVCLIKERFMFYIDTTIILIMSLHIMTSLITTILITLKWWNYFLWNFLQYMQYYKYVFVYCYK